MKGFVIPGLIVLLLIGMIIYFAGSKLIGIASLTPAEVSYQGCNVKEGYYVKPLMGYFKCESIKNDYSIKDMSGMSWPKDVCCVYSTDYCTVDFYAEGTFTNTKLSKCGTSGCTGGEQKFDATTGWTGTLDVGECYRIHATQARVLKFTFNYRVYSLVNYPGSGGRHVVDQPQYGCSLQSGLDLMATCPDSYTGQCLPVTKASTYLSPGESVNYFEDWYLSVDSGQYAWFEDTTKGDIYCRGNGLVYNVGTLTVGSDCYKYPTTPISCPECKCCPGTTYGTTLICGNDFLWHQSGSDTTPCQSQLQCGDPWQIDFSDASRHTAVKSECVSGYCKLTDTKQVGCTSNTACASGELCIFNPATGDGTCKSPDPVPVPPDPTNPDIWSIIKRIFICALVAGVLLFIINMAGQFFPPLRPISMVIRRPKVFMIAWVVFTIILSFIFAAQVASIFGGII